METIKLIIQYIYIGILALTMALTVANFIYTKIKSKKITKALEANDRERATELQEEGNPFEELLFIIKDHLPTFIKVAEKSANTGEAKKFIAMAQLMLECNKQGLDFQDYEEELSKLIDDLVAMTKEVNTFHSDYSKIEQIKPNEVKIKTFEGGENGEVY